METKLTIMFYIFSCNEISTPEENSSKPLPNNQELADTEKIIDNDYTKIVLSLCDDTGKYKFTENNTTYFDLNVNDFLDCFAFSSEIQCGHPGGSCGYIIQVYKKSNVGYSIEYTSCGCNLTPSIESNYGTSSFTYLDKGRGSNVKVLWNGKKFEEEILTVNN